MIENWQQDLRRQAAEQMDHWGIPGLSIGVFFDGEAYFLPLGVGNVQTQVPVSEEMLFPAGSVSKSFTATLLMTLVDEGLADLDEPVRHYIPELQLSDERAGERVTLRHLLSHTSGIFGDYFEDHGQGDDALARAVRHYDAVPQVHEPGELWAYSNTGYCLAGAVAAQILGTTYEEALINRVIDPLQLDRTVLFAHDAITYPVAVGHVPDDSGEPQVNRQYLVTRHLHPAAGVISTAADMVRFAAFHLGDGRPILQTDHLNEMHRRQTEAAHRADAWGLGWGIKDLGAQVLEHTGSVNGTAAQLTLVPEQDFAICVLANGAAGLGATRKLCNWALQRCCGLNTDPPAAVDLPERALRRLSGTYRQPSGEVRVCLSDAGIRVEPQGGAPFTAYPIDECRFVIEEGAAAGLRVEFVIRRGEVEFVNINGRLLSRVHSTDG